MALLIRLSRLAPTGPIILRESGIRSGVEVPTETYPVVYRSVQEYEAMAVDAGLTDSVPVAVRPLKAEHPSREIVVAWRAGSSRAGEGPSRARWTRESSPSSSAPHA